MSQYQEVEELLKISALFKINLLFMYITNEAIHIYFILTFSIGRHSKSLDIERKRCGHCYGKFEVLLNKINKKGETKAVPTPKKEPTGFALFVKQHYATYKDSNLKHGDVMKILGQKFQQMKVGSLQSLEINSKILNKQ